jgi:hypothetical protein
MPAGFFGRIGEKQEKTAVTRNFLERNRILLANFPLLFLNEMANHR